MNKIKLKKHCDELYGFLATNRSLDLGDYFHAFSIFADDMGWRDTKIAYNGATQMCDLLDDERFIKQMRRVLDDFILDKISEEYGDEGVKIFINSIPKYWR